MTIFRRISITILIAGVALLTGCRYLVDEDLSDCGGEISINYQLRLIANMQVELETVLSEEADIPTADAPRNYLKYIFSDVARDVDLSFYSPEGEMPRKVHIREIIDASQAHYVVYLPEQEYMHTCVANMEGNGPVQMEDTLLCQSARLALAEGEEVSTQHTGIFTSRLPIKIRENDDNTFYSYLYMANSATALILDTDKAGEIGEIDVATSGFADSFDIADSTYHYSRNYIVRPEELALEQAGRRCFVSVNFPSRDFAPGSKAFGDDFIWSWRIRVPLPDGTVTETILGVSEPLKAGNLKIIKAKVYDTGVVSVTDPQVGVSVTLDWQDAGEHEVEF